MKTCAAVLLAIAVVPSLARADDPGMQLMMMMMRLPAMSADGKHLALFSEAPGDDKAAKTSLAVFGVDGKLEQRLSIVPPVVDVERATADVAKVAKLLDDGKYQRMSRVSSKGGVQDKNGGFSIELASEDVALTLKITGRKISITGTRADKKLAPVTFALPPKDGTCGSSGSFSVANTMAGYDKKSQLLAFGVSVFSGDTGCFGHDFVIPLK